ncbi:c-type cytochrome [Aquibaculum sediminis]|uniref:c-type cytochrome n=1 Tax=Aquibaculum sediminis TaxID=3231907 RepID=UPI0034516025
MGEGLWWRSLLFASLLLGPLPAAAMPELAVEIAGERIILSAEELLGRPDTQDISVPQDVAYKEALQYRALPIAELLSAYPVSPDGEIEFIASDGFASLIPAELLLGDGEERAVAWLAIEPPDDPWPALPGKQVSAGPFYLVWMDPEKSGVRSEQWPYAVVRMREVEPAASRWPEIAVDAALPAEHAARLGQEVFVTQCLACHTLNGAGSATMGPDLNQPANPTRYFTEEGLRRLLRDPASLRSWPAMQMPAFSEAMLSEAELDAVIAYLRHMADR